MAGIAVVGSANLDLIGRAERLPRPGESVLGHGFSTSPGGKGANQAVACARLGAPTSLVGRVGNDGFGPQLRANLQREGVDIAHLAVDDEAPTGVALIMVDDEGGNSILVAPGANGRLAEREVESALLANPPTAVLLQLEVPLACVLAAARQGRAQGARVILNPAPGQPLPQALLSLCDVLTPNEHELWLLAGQSAGKEEERRVACRSLLDQGVGAVVVTLGAEGALVATREAVSLVPGFSITTVDTTGAGDAFNGALCVALADGLPLLVATRFACAAGALATTALGAQAALPTRAEVEGFLAERCAGWRKA